MPCQRGAARTRQERSMALQGHMIRIRDSSYIRLREESLAYQLALGRQVSMGEIVAAALHIAAMHPDQMMTEITNGEH
jgi:hypothetical protein